MQWFTEFLKLFFISIRLIKTLKFILSGCLGTTKAGQQATVCVSAKSSHVSTTPVFASH